MAAYQKYEAYIEHVHEGVHNLGTATLMVALHNAANAPSLSADAVLADTVQIAYTNLSSRVITTSSSSQTGGTYSLILDDLVLSASGAVAPFRYVSIYNNTPVSLVAPLICMVDYGSEITMQNGHTFTLDFDVAGLFTAS